MPLNSRVGMRRDNIAHLGLFGDRADVKDGGQVVELSTFLQPSLKTKNRRVLKIHHGKTAHQDVMQAIAHFPHLPTVFYLPEALGHGSS